MATYTKTTNFTAKDNLTSGDPAKVIKGSEFDTEFNAIETAVNSKADKNNGVHTGTTTISTANIDTLQIDSVTVTATSAELNTLDGITSTTAELNKLDGYTGDVTDLNKLASVTATATEINVLDGSTATTADLNKLAGVTATSTELNLLDGVTATTTELNYVDGVTSSVQTQLDGKQPLDAQLTDIAGLTPADGTFIVGDGTNFVAESGDTAIASLGVTATAAELNTLDGITATTTELNYTDGVTSNIQTQLNSKASATASPTLTLDGDVSGSATMTNLGNATLTVTVADDSHNHTIANVDGLQTALDGKATTAQGALADSAVQPNDNVSFGTGDFSGNVDVTGTITADAADIAGAITADGLTVESGSPVFTIHNTLISQFENNLIGKIDFEGSDASSNSSGVRASIQATVNNTVGATSLDFYTRDSGSNPLTKGLTVSRYNDVHFYEDTGTTAKMVWDASAESLGIGTSSPQTPIEISGPKNTSAIRLRSTTNDASWSAGDYFGRLEFWSNDASGAGAGAKGSIVTATTGGSGGANYMAFNVASTATNDIERMRITSSGNVGIGETNPTGYKLHVKSAGSDALRLFNTSGSGNTIDFLDQSWQSQIQGNAGSLLFKTGGTTERMRIDSSGNVGIGTSSPDNPLTIQSSSTGASIKLIGRASDGYSTLAFRNNADTSTLAALFADESSDALQIHTNGTERARIDSSGNLLVGTTSARGEGIVSKKGINYRSSNNSINGVQTYTRTYVSDQNNWRTILTRGTNTQGIAEVTVYTSYATPASVGSITRVLVLPNQTYTVISQEGSSTNGYSSMEFQWVGDDFQVRTVAQYLSYTCLVLLSDSGANLWPSQS